MTGVITRSRLTLLGLAAVGAAVVVAVVTAPDPDLPNGPPASALDRPCSYVFDLEAQENRLVWFFGQADVPSELVKASTGAVNYCESGFSAAGGERDYEFAVTFVFTEGEGEARREAVWWLFYPAWDEPTRWGERLFHDSGAEPVYHDGYIVAVSPDASATVRAAAEATPDLDAWVMWYESSASLR